MNVSDANRVYEVGASLGGEGFEVHRVDYTHEYRPAPHSHDTIGITLIVGGHFRESVEGVVEDATALSVVVKPPGTVHANEVGPDGARTIAVSIEEGCDLLEESRKLGGWRWCHAGAGLHPLLALARTLSDPTEHSGVEGLIVELLGEVIDGPAPPRGDAPLLVRRAREALDDLATEGIEVRQLAESLSVHPVSLTRAFRRAYGVSVSAYRRQVRLRRAAAELAARKWNLSAVAQLAGYSDQSHMCREVRSATGLTPRALRRLAREESAV